MTKILLKHLHILTFNKTFKEIKDGYILIEDNLIKEVGKFSELKKTERTRSIDCSGKVAMPGLINSHTHVPMSFFKGLGHSTSDIIHSKMFPAETNLKATDMKVLTTAGAMECLRGGCTSIVEHYYFAEEIAKTLKDIGLRGFVGPCTLDLTGPDTSDKSFQLAYDFIDKWKSDNFITPILAPHATDTLSEERFLEFVKHAEKNDLLIHLHLAQTEREFSYITNKFNKTPVEYLNDLGVLSERVLAAHLIHLTDNDINILAKQKVNYLCSVVSQLFFEKLAPIEKLWNSGINFCLATDCVMCNDGMDLFNEAKAFNLFLIDKLKDPLALRAKNVFELATKNTAKALKVSNKLGSIENNKLADIIVLDIDKPRMRPTHDIYNNLLYSHSERDIDMVVVDGRIIIEKGDFVNVDEKEISHKLTSLANDIFKRKKS